MVTRKELFNALGFVESSGNQKAVSPKGAIGTYQGMPATLDDPGFGVKPRRNNSLDEADRVTKDYMMAMLNRHGGDLERALVSYNYGPGAADKWIASGAKKKDLPKETRDYLIKMKKALGGANMARRPLEFIKQDKLSALTKKAIKNPDSPDARKVVKELLARNLPVPNTLKGSLGKARAGSGSPPPTIPGDRGPYASYTEKQRAALNKELPKSKKTVSSVLKGQARPFSAPRGDSAKPVTRQMRVQKRVGSESAPVRPAPAPVPVPFPKRKPALPVKSRTAAELDLIPAKDAKRGARQAAQKAEGDAWGALKEPKRKTAAKHILNDDPKLAQANEYADVKTEKEGFSLSDLFDSSKYKKTSGPDDYSPAKRTYDTPLGEIDLDTSEEGMFGDSELYDMGQKKGGRLKKAAGKKAVTKKPVAKKKAVKKNTVRKRAALRGHRAELRGG